VRCNGILKLEKVLEIKKGEILHFSACRLKKHTSSYTSCHFLFTKNDFHFRVCGKQKIPFASTFSATTAPFMIFTSRFITSTIQFAIGPYSTLQFYYQSNALKINTHKSVHSTTSSWLLNRWSIRCRVQ